MGGRAGAGMGMGMGMDGMGGMVGMDGMAPGRRRPGMGMNPGMGMDGMGMDGMGMNPGMAGQGAAANAAMLPPPKRQDYLVFAPKQVTLNVRLDLIEFNSQTTTEGN